MKTKLISALKIIPLALLFCFPFSIIFSCSDSNSENENQSEVKNQNQENKTYDEFSSFVKKWAEPETYSLKYKNGIQKNDDWREHYAYKSPGEIEFSYENGKMKSISGKTIDSINEDYESDEQSVYEIYDPEFLEDELDYIKEKREKQISELCFLLNDRNRAEYFGILGK